MSVRERSKEKEESREKEEKEKPREDAGEKPATEDLLEQHTPEVSVEQEPGLVEVERETAVSEETTVEPEEIRPSWGSAEEAEWMYQVPDREDDRELWAKEWTDFILSWMEQQGVHVISIATFITEQPFSEIVGKTDAFKALGDRLVEDNIAKWIGEEKRQLRVYWRPLEDWADHIYRWALETGSMRLDVKSMVIQEGRESFARLPEEDLHGIMRILIERGYAEWVDREKGAIVLVM